MLNEVAEDAAEARRDKVGGVAQEDGGAFACFWVAPCSLYLVVWVVVKTRPLGQLSCSSHMKNYFP